MKLAALVVLAALAALAGPMPAQRPDDIKEILQKIRSDMELIDKLLQEASTKPVGRSGASGEQPKPKKDDLDQLLDSSVEKSRTVVEQIEKLLEMAQQQQQQQSQSQQQRDRQQRGSKSQQEQERERQRQETPDHVQQQQARNEPDNPRPDQDPGRNEKGEAPKDPESSRTDRDRSPEAWGDLPPYLQMLFRRSGEPKVPAKYQPYTEEFHKRADRKKK